MPHQVSCPASKENFTVSDLEMSIRGKFGFTDPPKLSPKFRFMQLGAFWPHWNLHPRKCDKTDKNIISVYREQCDYPVWHRDTWLKQAEPPTAELDISNKFFDQLWKLFKTCPIPHTTGLGNENSEYTDDVWYSRNCYLCHSGVHGEDLKYSYRYVKLRDCNFTAFSFESELCLDIVNCFNCFELLYGLNCRNVQTSAFMYDCRNCNDCMFCWNLRNKKHCWNNEQLTQEEYEKRKADWDLSSRTKYDEGKKIFSDIMMNQAFHRAQSIDLCQESSGDFIDRCKNAENCYFLEDVEDCVNSIRGGSKQKDTLDTLCGTSSELLMMTTLVGESYNCTFSFQMLQCRFVDYSAHCFQCEYCFGCCGLVGKKYCIFNKQYSEEAYKTKREAIINHMKQTGEWGMFFPGYFAPNPYSESWSSFYFPLTEDQQKSYGFRTAPPLERKSENYLNPSEIPDNPKNLTPEQTQELLKQIFWDEKSQRRFQIHPDDLKFAQKINCPLPNCYYVRRIQENFRWLPFTGVPRKTTCAKTGKAIETSWPVQLDGKILSEEAYLETIG